MTLDDVKGVKPTRWWKVRNVTDPFGIGMDLKDDDLLVFDATNLKIIRIRPTTTGPRIASVDDWGWACAITSPTEITGTHRKGSILIGFNKVGSNRADHVGEVKGKDEGDPAGTWAADEGP